MRGELVSLDLESTGLDYMQDAIIEVGAVRMANGEIIDQYSTFVDPGIPIPDRVTHITGIAAQDVSGAPRITAVLPDIAAFVGDAPLIAHNITLDMGFLQKRHKILQQTPAIDTYDLAAVLLPNAPRYNLNSLTTEVGIDIGHAHRALDDARATALLYWELWQRLLTLPRATVEEIVRLSSGLGWQSIQVFEAALKEDVLTNNVPTRDPFPAFHANASPLTNASETQPIDVDAMTHTLQADGKLSQHLPTFEERTEQQQMAEAVASAFNRAHPLIVEAGTGTGKSLAYLLPAALWATHNGQRVVIATNTINLQDQLINQDIPQVQAVLDIPLEAAVLKGRSNYICPRRLATLRRRRPTNVNELKMLAKVLVWLLDDQSGDRSTISVRGPVENTIWNRLSAADEGCTLTRCENAMSGTCPFYKARKQAETAHLLIVNHALLISDSANGGGVLPEYRHLIVDEAHHLEDAITHGLTFRIDQNVLLRRLSDLGGTKSGLLGDLLAQVRAHAPAKRGEQLAMFVASIEEATTLMRHHVEAYFMQLLAVLESLHKSRSGDYTTLVRVTAQNHNKASFNELQSKWRDLAEFFDVLADAMKRLTKAMQRLVEYDLPDHNDFVFSVETAARYLQTVHEQLATFTEAPDPNLIYWLGIGMGADERPTLNAAPLHIGGMVENELWLDKDTVILTSATLRTGDNFEFLQSRLNADNIPTVEVGSPFDYKESTLVYLPDDIPEPNDRGAYQRMVERTIIELAAALNGRVMVLFTSYTQLRQTASNIGPRLALGGINVYDQSDGSSRQTLVNGFKSSEKAILMGTRSFWEGVDIPGESLSALIITRLPFAVPSDPIFVARSEDYSNSFEQYAVPDAVLRFRQGFGRLIRHRNDRGVCVVLDKRIVSKGYGLTFLASLPDCTVEYGAVENLPKRAKSWLQSDA